MSKPKCLACEVIKRACKYLPPDIAEKCKVLAQKVEAFAISPDEFKKELENLGDKRVVAAALARALKEVAEEFKIKTVQKS